jgi:hypothetical protein
VVPVPVATVRPTPTPTPTPSRTPSPTAASLSLAVSDPNPRAGQWNVMVTGGGFDPTQQYEISFLQGPGGQVLFGPASPNGSGSFSSPVRIPFWAQPGAAVLQACVYLKGQGPTSRCATVPIDVRG